MRKSENILKSMISALGVIGTFVTIIWAIFESILGGFHISHPWLVLFLILAIAFLYALFANRRKNRIDVKLSSKVSAAVYFGDIFTEKEVTVIPVNEYFDTIVDEKIVSSKTLHGMFINRYFPSNKSDLESQIRESLENVEGVLTLRDNSAWSSNRYPLGTVCQVVAGGKTFFLVALTRFNSNDRAEVTNSEYQRVLCDLFSYIEQNSQGRNVSIPLIGAGHSGVDLTKQKLLEFLLFSINMQDQLTLIGGVNVVLHESVKSEIDLSLTEILFRSIRS